MSPSRALRPLLVVLLLLLGGAGLAACGSDDGPDPSSTAASGGASSSQQLVVSAATSLKKALTTYGDEFTGGEVRASFAGSDALAAQIRKGVRPDVFASANTKLPDALFKEGLVEQPVVFATNELVLAVPADGAEVTSLDDLSKSGTTLAIGAEGVPVGDYTRTVLGKLPAAQSKAILENVRSDEPDVGGVVGKIATGAVDAGFVYASDVRGAGGEITAIELPADLEPVVEYGVAVVKGAKNPTGAKAFVDGLLTGPGAAALKANGFGAPPAR
jgi:molybdate transport system substrate-binding protein